jgi:hypothetical protein
MMSRTQPRTPPQHQPERICAFYSKGPHFVRMLKRLREDYPDEIIVAAIPESFPYPAIARLAHETIRLPDPGCLGAVRRGWTTLRRLRRVRCGHLVVMFDSPRLNLLARLSGTGRGWCFTVDGRLFVLNQPLLTLLLQPILDRLRGELQYRRARVGTRRRSRQKD